MEALESILNISASQIEIVSQASQPTFPDLLALFQEGTRDQRKESVQLFADDLFKISASVFLKNSPLDLSLGKDLRETKLLFDNLSSLITYTILYLSDDLKSAQRISKFWLRVAKKLLEMGDGATSATISWVLSAPYHERLAYDGDTCLIKNYDEDFKELYKLFSPIGSFRAYRDHSNQLKVPCIAIAKKDLIYMREAKGNFGGGGLPDLISLVGRKVEEICVYQENLQKDSFRGGGTNIESLLLSAGSLLEKSGAKEDELYSQSSKLRPRKK
jgi:hypothetical protein